MAAREAMKETLQKWGKLRTGHTFYIYKRNGECIWYVDILSRSGTIIDSKQTTGMDACLEWLVSEYGYSPEF